MKEKSLIQKILSTNAVTMADWLAMKPYNHPIKDYDVFYLAQCQEVLRQLNTQNRWFQNYDMSREQLKELSCQLVSYFEDYINDIGIWNAFIDTNQELYGYPLPFYDVSEHDKTYINIEDIAFLIWHYLSKYTEEEYLINPDHDNIMDLAKLLFTHFENVMDDGLAVDFYDDFFTIKDHEDYFVFKTKMSWFTTKSYLLGVDFRERLANKKAEIAQQAKQSEQGATLLPVVLYNMLERYLFQKRSSFSALNGPEWFAKVAKCSEHRKAEIVDLTYWIDGKFIIRERLKDCLVFEHLLTNNTYKARLDSFKSNKDLQPSDKFALNMHLIRWNGEYLLSGMMYHEDLTPLNVKKYRASRCEAPWILSDKTIAEMYKQTQTMYEAFVAFFGDELVTFDTHAQLTKANTDYLNFYQKKTNPNKTELDEQRIKKYREMMGIAEPKTSDTALDKNAQSFAMFFIKDVALYTFQSAKAAIALLKAPKLTPDEEAYLCVDFINGHIPPVCDYLIKKYGGKNLRFPTIDNTIDVVKYLPFFHRMNSPEEFDKPYPMITVFSTQELDV